MSRRKMRLRTRLLVLQLAVFGGLLLLAGPVTYLLLSRTLHRDRDQYLVSMARTLSAEYSEQGGRAAPVAGFPPRCLPEPVMPDSTNPEATHRPRHLLVCDDSGAVLCSDGETVPLAPEAVERALRTRAPSFADIRWSSEILRIIAWPFENEGGRTLVMEVGTSYWVIEGVLEKGLLFMALVSAASFLILIAAGYYLTRGALLPIERVIHRVEHIDEANLAERLPKDEKTDEVGRLITVINRMLDRLEAAFKAQSRFSSDVAHEIRSPLTALRGQLEVSLRKERSAEEYRLTLKENLEEVLRLSRLAEDLMSLAKADAGVLEIRRVEVDLRDVLYRALLRFKPRARAKNIELGLHAPDPVPVWGDPDLLDRLFENLLDNALIHTPHMGEIDVRLRMEDGHAEAAVEDTGAGIPPEHLERIFDRFYRVDPARSRDRGGAGLGLSIARQIVTLHAGSIRVESEAGKGTVFLVTLPSIPAGA